MAAAVEDSKSDLKCSIFDQIKSFKGSKLNHVTTVVTDTSGHRVQSDLKGSDCVELEQTGPGFVIDNKPDFSFGLIYDWLVIGSVDVALNHDLLKELKITHILSLVSISEDEKLDGIIYECIKFLDVPESDLLPVIEQCSKFLDMVCDIGGKVLIHCNAGISRCAAIAIGYVMKRDRIGFEAAFQLVQKSRPKINPNPGFRSQLKQFEMSL